MLDSESQFSAIKVSDSHETEHEESSKVSGMSEHLSSVQKKLGKLSLCNQGLSNRMILNRPILDSESPIQCQQKRCTQGTMKGD